MPALMEAGVIWSLLFVALQKAFCGKHHELMLTELAYVMGSNLNVYS